MSDILAQMRKAMDTIKFAEIVREEARRTVLCNSADVDRIRWWVDQSGYDDILTVLGSEFVPAGQMYVVDNQALDASTREAIQRMSREFRFRGA